MSNDALNKLLIDAIQKTEGAVGQAVDFAMTQAPDVIQQLLKYNFVVSLIWFCIWMVSAAFFLFWILWGLAKKKNYDDGYCVLFLALIASIAFAFCCDDWIKIYFAPKLYLIEYAAHLVK